MKPADERFFSRDSVFDWMYSSLLKRISGVGVLHSSITRGDSDSVSLDSKATKISAEYSASGSDISLWVCFQSLVRTSGFSFDCESKSESVIILTFGDMVPFVSSVLNSGATFSLSVKYVLSLESGWSFDDLFVIVFWSSSHFMHPPSYNNSFSM